ncbi:MAG TPA: carboxymuconolactone decarboxylase family protein [Caulobacteraceae bacterium]|jgi:alkylhydroperoxidase family enzyme|nr:carboxymuconolactone decarboxylase family protein [Caulobacteraceae bacterium]
MRLRTPRIAPVADGQLTDDQKAALEGLPPLNIFRVLVRAPKALAGFLAWGNYVLSRRNSLPAREREIVILRTGYLCRSGYEFTQHTRIGLRDGLTGEEIAAIKAGAQAGNWSAADQALIRAADELHSDQFIGEGTWAALGEHFDDKQRMDVVFTVGQYTQVSMLLNTFGVQLEPGESLDPDLAAY